jgi:ACS family hexuronate transporter-like MFS transporter
MTSTAAARPGKSSIRWTVCALLFFATTVSYVDRQVLSILAKTLETRIGWNSIQYGYITASFQATYGIGLLFAGRVIDRLGTRRGFALAMVVWSGAAIAHAAAASALMFGVARALLGIGESANFPACIKVVAEWFPRKERAFSTALFNSGAAVGAVLAPAMVPWLAIAFGWQAAFLATGALGFVWVIFWLSMYKTPREHARVSAAELAHIESDPPDKAESVPWARLFPKRETWAFGAGKFLTDPVWWFYLFWLPKYLQETFGLALTQIMLPTVVVYAVSSIGSIGAGWLSGSLIDRGWSLNAARKTVMLACALAVVPVMYAPYSKNLWMVVGVVSLAAAAHQGWSAVLFTFTSDVFPRGAVGSVVGIGGTLGAIGGVLMQLATGYLVQLTHSYMVLFLISGSAYLVALGILQGLSPRLAPAKLN